MSGKWKTLSNILAFSVNSYRSYKVGDPDLEFCRLMNDKVEVKPCEQRALKGEKISQVEDTPFEQ